MYWVSADAESGPVRAMDKDFSDDRFQDYGRHKYSVELVLPKSIHLCCLNLFCGLRSMERLRQLAHLKDLTTLPTFALALGLSGRMKMQAP
jgi:hypothetical protein